MRRLAAFMFALLLAPAALAQTQPSAYPLATLPLNGTDAVLLDQCTNPGPPLSGCTTVQAPSTRIGQPIVSATPPSNPFLFEVWWNTGASPPQYSVWSGSAWIPVFQADAATGLPSFPGNVYLPSGFLSISNLGGTLTQVTPAWPITLFVNNRPSTIQGSTTNTYENATGTVGSAFRGFAARGTYVSPGAVQASDLLAGLHGSGYWSGKTNPYYTSTDARAAINLIATEGWIGVNNNGTAITFSTTPTGSSTMAEVARFDGSGNLGIGTTAPVSGITLTRNNIASVLPMGFTANVFENATGLVGSAFRGFSVRGTSGSPTNLVTNDILASLQGSGFYTGKASAQFVTGDAKAEIDLAAGENWTSSTNTGSYIKFLTTTNASGTPAERMRLSGTGGLAIGTTNDPGAGSLAATGALMAGFSVIPTAQAGSLALAKVVDSAAAPGAGGVNIKAVAGTNAGTCKIIAYAGTSATPVTIVDNIGSGC